MIAQAPVLKLPVLISAALICFCAGGLYGYSALIPVIERKFNGTTGQAGLVFSIAIVAFTIVVIIAPRLPSRLNELRGCALFGFVGAGCLVLSMVAPNYLLFLTAFSAGFGACSGAVYINALATAASAPRPAVVTPVMVASFGLGGAVYGFIWRRLVVNDWGTLALMPLVITLLVTSLFGLAVASRGVSSKTVEAAIQAENSPVDRSFTFLLLWLSFAFGSTGGLMVLGLAGKITDSVGATIATTSFAIAGVAIGNTAGRISVSGFNHVSKPVNTALIAVIIAATGLFVTAMAQTATLITIGLIVVATGYGAVASTIPALVGDIYGKDRFAQMFSVVFTGWGVAGLFAPWLAGVIYDRTGDFQWAVVIALLATLGSAVTLLLLKFITRPAG